MEFLKINDVLSELFPARFSNFQKTFNFENLDCFEDSKNVFLKEFPILERNALNLEQTVNKIEQFNQRVINSQSLNYTKLFNKFVFTLDNRIDRLYEKLYSKALENEERKEQKNDLNLFELRIKLKEEIIKVSNEIHTVFSEKGQIVYEEEFIKICEKIIKFNEFLKSNENSLIGKTRINTGVFLQNICSDKHIDFSDYLIIDNQKLQSFMNDNQFFSRNYPIYMSRITYILQNLHKIIVEEVDQTYKKLDFNSIARSVLNRDKRIVYKEITEGVKKSFENKKFEENADDPNDYREKVDGLMKEGQKIRIVAQKLIESQIYNDIVRNRVNSNTIRFLEKNKENEELLMHLERFSIEVKNFLKNAKDFYEKLVFFAKDEELFYKAKYYNVLKDIIKTNIENCKNNTPDQYMKSIFMSLSKLLKKEREEKDNNRIGEALVSQLKNNMKNNYLGESLKILHEIESRKTQENSLNNPIKKMNVSKIKDDNKNELIQASVDMFNETQKEKSPAKLAKNNTLDLKKQYIEKSNTVNFNDMSPRSKKQEKIDEKLDIKPKPSNFIEERKENPSNLHKKEEESNIFNIKRNDPFEKKRNNDDYEEKNYAKQPEKKKDDGPAGEKKNKDFYNDYEDKNYTKQPEKKQNNDYPVEKKNNDFYDNYEDKNDKNDAKQLEKKPAVFSIKEDKPTFITKRDSFEEKPIKKEEFEVPSKKNILNKKDSFESIEIPEIDEVKPTYIEPKKSFDDDFYNKKSNPISKKDSYEDKQDIYSNPKKNIPEIKSNPPSKKNFNLDEDFQVPKRVESKQNLNSQKEEEKPFSDKNKNSFPSEHELNLKKKSLDDITKKPSIVENYPSYNNKDEDLDFGEIEDDLLPPEPKVPSIKNINNPISNNKLPLNNQQNFDIENFSDDDLPITKKEPISQKGLIPEKEEKKQNKSNNIWDDYQDLEHLDEPSPPQKNKAIHPTTKEVESDEFGDMDDLLVEDNPPKRLENKPTLPSLHKIEHKNDIDDDLDKVLSTKNDGHQKKKEDEEDFDFGEEDVLDDLLGGRDSPPKKIEEKKIKPEEPKKVDVKKEEQKQIEDDEEMIEEDYGNDFEEYDDSGILNKSKKSNKSPEDKKNKNSGFNKNVTNTSSNNNLASPKKVIELEDLEITNEFLHQLGMDLEDGVKLDEYNNYDSFNFLMEEFLQQGKLFIYNIDVSDLVLKLFVKFEKGIANGKKKAVESIKKEFNGLTDQLQQIFGEMTSRIEFDPNMKIYFIFGKNEFDLLLLELDFPTQTLFCYYSKSVPKDAKIQSRLSSLLLFLEEVFNLEKLKKNDVSIPPSAFSLLSKSGLEFNYIKALLLIFNLSYETTSPKVTNKTELINISPATFERLYVVLKFTQTVYQLFEANYEAFVGYFEKMIADICVEGSPCLILHETLPMEKIELEILKEFAGQVFEAIQEKLGSVKFIFACMEVEVAGVGKMAYYIYLEGGEGEEVKMDLFYLEHYNKEVTQTVVSTLAGFHQKNFVFNSYCDYARHFGLYDHSLASVAIWAALTLKSIDYFDAFKLLTYSLVPFYSESMPLMEMMEGGEGGEGCEEGGEEEGYRMEGEELVDEDIEVVDD